MLLVKKWAKQRGVANSKNSTLSSYCWVLLVIHFLLHIEPPVCVALDPLEPTASKEVEFVSTNTDSVAELLLKFFAFYGSQAGGYVPGNTISVWGDSAVDETDCTDVVEASCEIDDNNDNTKNDKNNNKNNKNNKNDKKVWLRYFVVKDPVEVGRNVARVVYCEEAQTLMVAELDRGFRILNGWFQSSNTTGGTGTGNESNDAQVFFNELFVKNLDLVDYNHYYHRLQLHIYSLLDHFHFS